MEFMPQQDELPSGENVTETTSSPTTTVVEEELVAAIEIGPNSNQQASSEASQNSPSFSGALQPPQQVPQPEKPIYFSDGTLYPSQLNNPPPTSTSAITSQGVAEDGGGEMAVALPDNLLEIYNNLGLIGKLLTGGSLVTIKFIQAFRTFGESFVNVLGITKPKYEYELNLARQMQEAEAARVAKLDQLYSSWQQPQAQAHPPAQSSSSSYGMPSQSSPAIPPPPITPTYQGPYGVPTGPPSPPAAIPFPSPTVQYGSQQSLPPMSSSPPSTSYAPQQQQQQYSPAVLSVQSLPSQQPVHQPVPAQPAPVNLPPFPSPPELTQAAQLAASYSTALRRPLHRHTQ
ncbi:hypothetical protein TYRP_018000 [Tyrophagus putrescentiae]|nr:hypothetical protein TYRP_018000 [Tyrophagus putrescentiae]